MGWILAAVLAVITLAVLVLLFKLPRRTWEISAAALLLGLAGYALQGSPAQPGAAKAAPGDAGNSGSTVDDAGALPSDPLLLTARALARKGKPGDAANLALGAAEKNPANGEAWLAVANYLVGHAQGNLSPAALLAYDKAAQAAPDNPAPYFYLGLALAQSGRLEDGRKVWADLLARSPKDAPWRAELTGKLGQLDAFIASRQGMNPGP